VGDRRRGGTNVEGGGGRWRRGGLENQSSGWRGVTTTLTITAWTLNPVSLPFASSQLKYIHNEL